MTTKNSNRGRGLPSWESCLTINSIAFPIIVTLSLAEHFKGKSVRSRHQKPLFPPAHTLCWAPRLLIPLPEAWKTQPANWWPQHPACSQRACSGPWEDQGVDHSAGLVISASSPTAPIIPGSCISLRSLDSGFKRLWKGKAYFEQWTRMTLILARIYISEGYSVELISSNALFCLSSQSHYEGVGYYYY